MPPLYRETVCDPFIAKLDELGPTGFNDILWHDPTRQGEARLMFDIAHAILQNGEGYEEKATDAFEEVVSDLFDGFLSKEDRRGVKPPDLGAVAPLVKWGEPDSGPYTWPVDATSSFHVKTGIVNLPPANARRGLLAWAALGHETGGHDILHADTGLLNELASAVFDALSKHVPAHGIARYWADRMDETASDVLGILNMGPAAGIGLVGYFRGLNKAFTGEETLRNEGDQDDPHPADIVRGFLAAEVVRLLNFSDANAWADCIAAETNKNVKKIRLAGQAVEKQEAEQSAQIVAAEIVQRGLKALENHALGEIQNWTDDDEAIVGQLSVSFNRMTSPSEVIGNQFYAAHAVAAAVCSGLKKGGDVGQLFGSMVRELKKMHDANPVWGPLYVRHPGDLVRMRAYRF